MIRDEIYGRNRKKIAQCNAEFHQTSIEIGDVTRSLFFKDLWLNCKSRESGNS